MKFFAGAEMDKAVADKIRPVRNVIEEKIRVLIRNKNYGPGIQYWGYILIANSQETYEWGFFEEVKKFTKKGNELETRLKIDYESLLNADDKKIYELICKSIFRSIDIAENELNIKDFNFSVFRNDLTDLFKEEGWI